MRESAQIRNSVELTVVDTQMLLDVTNDGGKRSRLVEGDHSTRPDTRLFAHLLF